MKRKDILERLNALFEEKKQDMKKGKKKDEKKKGKEKPYVEDADADEKDDKKKKMPQDKGAYKSLSSSGIGDSTVAEEVLEESIDPKIKKEIDSMKKKRKDEITILMEIDKKYGSKLSKKDMEDIAAYLSED